MTDFNVPARDCGKEARIEAETIFSARDTISALSLLAEFAQTDTEKKAYRSAVHYVARYIEIKDFLGKGKVRS